MKKINGKLFKKAIISGFNAILNNEDKINSLNIFPVPDGDTGTNMSATIAMTKTEIEKLDSPTVGKVIQKIVKKTLLDSRGNSGVILSQIFKGWGINLGNKNYANVGDFIEAFENGKKIAYQAIMKPVEGTILTITKEMVKLTKQKQFKNETNLITFFTEITKHARLVVDNTPNLLPILKEVGLVDSGAEGFYQFLLGFSQSLSGKQIIIKKSKKNNDVMNRQHQNQQFGFCVEFIIKLKLKQNLKIDKFKHNLNKLGKDVVIGFDGQILKTHIHSLKTEQILKLLHSLGTIHKLKIENMDKQVLENQLINANTTQNNHNEPKIVAQDVAVISCNFGHGIANYMKNRGSNFVMEYQTKQMPSVQDFITAIKQQINKKIIILPNNSNLILVAAQAARSITKKKVLVINTKTQMQGIVAMSNFDPKNSLSKNKQAMLEVINEMHTIQITQANKKVKINNLKIVTGNYFAILNGKIIVTKSTAIATAITTLKKIINDEIDVVTIFFGHDSSYSDALELTTWIENNYGIETEINDGGQDIYNFLIAIE